MKKMTGKFMVKALLLMVMVSLFFSVGCKEATLSQYPELMHSWEWVVSKGGLIYLAIMPDSVGYTERIEFYPNGTFTKFRNNAVFASGRYIITIEKSRLDQLEYPIIRFNDGSLSQAIIEVTDNKLVLRDECTDYFTHDYIRIN